MENINAPKSGIAFEATVGQLIASFLLVIILLVLPIAGYEYLSGKRLQETKEVYTQQTLHQANEQGSVAGISTAKAQQDSSPAESVAIVLSSSTLLITIGVVFLTISVILASSLIYDFVKVS